MWPLQKDCDAFYGNPRGAVGRSSSAWEAANLTHVSPPFKMFYDGKPVQSVKIHRKCADSLLRVFNAIWVAAGKDQGTIDRWGVSHFGGSYNFRLMRGSTHLSMHSYGCAIDLAPERFPMGRHDHTFVPQVIKAFADEGWENLPNDRMHFQAARVPGLVIPMPRAAPVMPKFITPLALAKTPQPIIGVQPVATSATPAAKNILNTISLSGAFTLIGAAAPLLFSTFGTYGLVAAAALLACVLVQAFLPVGVTKSIEDGAISVIPAIEGIDPALKPILDQILQGLRAAQAQ